MELVITNCILPKELMEGILSRLPVRVLLRFKCVCKTWHAVIDHPSFISTHYRLQYDTHKEEGSMPLLLWRQYISFDDINLDDPSVCRILFKQWGDDVLVDMTADLERDTKAVLSYEGALSIYSKTCFVKCSGIANGIICLYIQCDYILNEFGWKGFCGLWNPATRDLNILLDLVATDHAKPYDIDVVGFGFDQVSNAYKVIAHILTTSGHDSLGDECDISGSYEPYSSGDECDISGTYELYSSSSASWKRLPSIGYAIFASNAEACLNGVHYWIGTKDEDVLRNGIIMFNFTTELFKVLDPPQCVAPANRGELYIELYKEYLALMITHRIWDEALAKVDIWVATKFDAEDFGVPLEWQCLLVIEPFPTSPHSICVMTPRMDGQLLLRTSDADPANNEWSLYDPDTRKIKNLGVTWLNCSFRYVESLFSVFRTTTEL